MCYTITSKYDCETCVYIPKGYEWCCIQPTSTIVDSNSYNLCD